MSDPKRIDLSPKPDTRVPPIQRPRPADPWALAERELADLDAKLPVALLPVRLETRFVGAELWVRVYPDTIHADPLRRALTEQESAAGAAFWAKPGSAAWQTLLAAVGGPWRAAWVLRSTRKGAEKADADSAEGTPFRLLPRRWVVVGTLDGEEVIRAAGSEIPAALRGGLDLDAADAGQLLAGPTTGWMFDFAAAVARGMALRIPLTGPAAAAADRGLDTLLVFGASSRSADDLRVELEDLLVAHHYTRGVGFMAQGDPTNRGAGDPDPRRPDLDALLAAELLALRGERVPSEPANPTTPRAPTEPAKTTTPSRAPTQPSSRPDVARPHIDPTPTAAALARALGVADDLLVRLDGADDREQSLARAMNTVLWPITVGGLLWTLRGGPNTPFNEPALLASPAAIAAVRRHFLRDVRGPGPLPTLRLGSTPYGFLPVCAAPRAGLSGERVEVRLQGVLHNLLKVWQRAAADLPVIDPGADDGADDPAVASAFAAVVAGQAWPTRYALRKLVDSPLVGDPDKSFALGGMSAAQKKAYRARVGLLIAAGLTDDELPPANRFGPPVLRGDYEDDVIAWAGPHAATAARTPSLWMQLVSHARQTLKYPLHAASQADRDAELVEVDAAVKLLEAAPEAVRLRVLGQSLGLAATRLDAWLTATATRRLTELREATPRGLQVGGWGVVHDLRPADAPRGGYALAPSLAQAATAAALRCGHAAYSVDAGSPYAVDLSSERVRLARWLYDGVRQGQSLSALLGQRFERILHEHGADHLVRPIRAAALSARKRDDPPNHVIDGLLVARALWPVDEPTAPEAALADHAALKSLRVALGERVQGHLADRTPGPHLARTRRHLGARKSAAELGELALAPLREAIDALADTATYDAAYQLFTGDRSAAAATLAAVDRGEAPPPALRSLETPRGGLVIAHRVVLLLAPGGAASPWPAADSAAALAEPRLERWVAAQLGAPAEIHAVVETIDRTTAAVRRRDPVTLARLAPISALDFARLSAAGAWQDGPLAAHLLADRGAAADELLRLAVPDTPPAGAIDLAEAHALAARLALAWRGRPATAEELAPLRNSGSAEPLRRIDRADLHARLDAVTAWLSGQVTRLAADERPARVAALRRFTAFGAAPLAPPADLSSEPDEALRARASALAAAVDVTLRALARARAAADADALAAFTAAVGPLVDGVPLLPVYAATTGPARAALANQLAVDPVRISSWLGQLARVRPRIDAVADALRLAEARHARPPFALRAGQTGASAAWAATERPTDDLPCTCITAVLGPGVDPDGPLAALAVDAWSERIPGRDQPAGLALQHPSPAACAPQVVLLATPSPGVAAWSLAELQAAAASALTLARIRAVGPDRLEQLGHLLPCIFLDGGKLAVEPGGQVYLDTPAILEYIHMPQGR
jgi:hypothetical protein